MCSQVFSQWENERFNFTSFHIFFVVFFFKGIQTFGRNVVVVGRSKNVGMPISMILHTDGEHERPGGRLKNILHYSIGNVNRERRERAKKKKDLIPYCVCTKISFT